MGVNKTPQKSWWMNRCVEPAETVGMNDGKNVRNKWVCIVVDMGFEKS